MRRGKKHVFGTLTGEEFVNLSLAREIQVRALAENQVVMFRLERRKGL
jgi:hypothetical protein